MMVNMTGCRDSHSAVFRQMTGAVIDVNAAGTDQLAGRRGGMTAVKGIIFDKDGTLFDFTATWGVWCRNFIMELSGGDPARMTRLADVLGYDLVRSAIRPDAIVIAQSNAEIAARIAPLFPAMGQPAILARMDNHAIGLHQVEAAPLQPLIAGLRGRGMALGLVTNDSEKSARAHLGAAGIGQLFDFIAGYDSGHGGKPAPGPLLAFAAACRLDPADCVMVGDSVHDLQAARAANMRGIGVLTGIADRAALSPHADVVLASIANLPGWLDSRLQNRA